MIHVIFDGDVFKAKGSFSFGIAGVFKNEDFDDEQIMFDADLADEINERSKCVEPLLQFIESNNPNEIAKSLSEYYNQKEYEISINAKQINDSILHRLFWDIEGCEYPFWQIPSAVSVDFLEAHKGENLEKLVYSGKRVITDFEDCFDYLPNNGTVQKPDIQAKIRECYPMFNLDRFINSFNPECLYLNGRYMSFQFSDGWGAEIACSACDQLDECFTFTDWHNH